MVEYVFDTEPLLAYLYGEPGGSAVAELLRPIERGEMGGSITHATAVELAYKTMRLEGTTSNLEIKVGREVVRSFLGIGLSIQVPSWETIARVKAPGGIALGDCYSAALASERDAVLVVGGDPEFDDLPLEVELRRVTA